MIYKTFDELIVRIQTNKTAKPTVAVVAAEDQHTLEAVSRATRDGVVIPTLIGQKECIKEQLVLLGERASDFSIIHAETPEDAAYKAAELVNSGQARFLMKGLIQTASLMKILLSDKGGLRTGRLMSHLAFAQIPNYHKLLGITDTALNIYPDVHQKRDIVENAVNTMMWMGFDIPKVAILAAAEQINPKMIETVDAAEIKKLYTEGSLQGCIIEGPISYDLAICRKTAEIKGFKNAISGDVDLMVVPNISAGNILIKALKYSAGAKSAGIVVGAKVPIALSSRGSSVDDKYFTLVLAASAVL